MTGMWVIVDGEYSASKPVGVAGSLDAAVAWVKATAQGTGTWSGPHAFRGAGPCEGEVDDERYQLELYLAGRRWPEVWTFERVPVIGAGATGGGSEAE